ncbi:heterokaryon incompatibility protein-domain-containing protein [Lasiosphaeris hirsuta]|uniref:Heterokaryon incompatibility protein-domain-containing protein n=1 Tax=Lasiosphaeris hirsuta TaxID=260670 RepID=A0AA40ANR5_9PEZI|nr:heterokaryon incompatibility protein-domain-containing protein [Lasiosphaeris hirsuta]
MRLINTTTLELEEFPGANVPPYAILSHTWGKDELTMAELETIAKHRRTQVQQAANLKEGFSKVSYTCTQASQDGYQYAWVDTVCIDKMSSAEMSEAINSMYSWYHRAAVCYAYLPDVQHGGQRGAYRMWKDDFAESRWFLRGWTLQELLAPRKLQFFGAGWKLLGTKASLARTIVKATGIDRRSLLDPTQIRRIPAARRMCWAIRRSTTKPEDIAYSLMGLFGVSMPILYGEGAEVAFTRLQTEIIKRTPDQSLFAWGILGQEDAPVHHHTKLEEFDDDAQTGTLPILARSPRDFAGMERVVLATPTVPRDVEEHEMTHRGLKIKVKLVQAGKGKHASAQRYYIASLDCRHEFEDPIDRLGILLAETEVPNVLVRTRTRKHTRVSGEDLESEGCKERTVYISNEVAAAVDGEEEKLLVHARDLITPGYDIEDVQAKQAQWNREFGTMRLTGMAAEDGAKGCVYQLAVLTFFNRHLGSGFLTRIMVDGTSGESFVDLLPPPESPPVDHKMLEGKDEAEAEARKIWESPGKAQLPLAKPSSIKGASQVRTVDVVNPETFGEEEEDQPQQGPGKPRSIDGGGGDAQKLHEQVHFSEMWEKEYYRIVDASITRKKRGVIVLDMGSQLFAAPE